MDDSASRFDWGVGSFHAGPFTNPLPPNVRRRKPVFLRQDDPLCQELREKHDELLKVGGYPMYCVILDEASSAAFFEKYWRNVESGAKMAFVMKWLVTARGPSFMGMTTTSQQLKTVAYYITTVE
jgi:hypothetical protein